MYVNVACIVYVSYIQHTHYMYNTLLVYAFVLMHIYTLDYPYPVECWLAVAENNVDRLAMRPDEVSIYTCLYLTCKHSMHDSKRLVYKLVVHKLSICSLYINVVEYMYAYSYVHLHLVDSLYIYRW